MLFGAGLTAGLLGQIGEALGSRTLDRVADIVSWVLPFEALYQAALSAITADTVGFTRLAIDLGPFGGAEAAGPLLWPWAVLYLAAVVAPPSRGATVSCRSTRALDLLTRAGGGPRRGARRSTGSARALPREHCAPRRHAVGRV